MHELRRQGGGNLKESVLRMLNHLLSPTFQLQFNRTGSHGKIPFAKDLEPLLKGKFLLQNN